MNAYNNADNNLPDVGNDWNYAQKNLESIINSSKQQIFLLNREYKIISFNNKACNALRLLIGRRPSPFMNFSSFLPFEEREPFKTLADKVMDGQEINLTREIRFGRASRWYEITFYPLGGRYGISDGLVVNAEDITDKKQAEEKFKELEIGYKSVFRQVAVGVMLYDLSFNIIQANKKFYDMLGYTEEEFLRFSTWTTTHPDDVEASVRHAQDLVNGKYDSYSLEKRYIHKSGRVLWVYLTATIARDQKGFPKHIISVVQDITARKKAEEDLVYKNNELDTFVYRASHDLKGPVASLMGLHNIVKSEFEGNETAMRYFDHYNSNVIRLNNILQNLINLAKIKEMETHTKPVNIGLVIDDCLALLSNLPGFEKIRVLKQVSLTSDISTDPGLIQTIVLNLIENAIKYSRELSPEIKIVASHEAKILKLEVEDNGLGIEENYQSKIFDMFFRGTDHSSGSGLGLYIVKNAVDKLKGTIQLESKPGKGSRFSIYIPTFQRGQ